MKTQIFHLEDYDDFLSARDQIGWSKASRILLVFPDKMGTDFALTDFILLAREANRIGAAAAFILRDKGVRNQLDQLGLVCFRSIREANRSRWLTGRRMKRLDQGSLPLHRTTRHEMQEMQFRLRMKIRLKPVWRVIAFLFAIAAVIVLAALFFPKARITLAVDRQIQQYTFQLQGNSIRETAPYNGIIQIYPLEFTLKDEIWEPTSDEVNLAIDHASGSIELYNLTNQSLSIPAGLVIAAQLSEPIRFETSRQSTLMAGYGSKQMVPIRAVLPGENGNVPAGFITAVEGKWANSIQATNPQATDGGTSITVPTPTENDIQRARKMLLDRLDLKAEKQARNLIQPGQVLVEESLQRKEILYEQANPAAGQPAEELHLQMETSYKAWYMLEDDLMRISDAMLDVLLPRDYRPTDGPLIFNFSKPVRITENGFEQEVEISRKIEGTFSSEELFIQIAGMDPNQAVQTISGQVHLAGGPLIELFPDRWPVLPFFRYQYEIIGK